MQALSVCSSRNTLDAPVERGRQLAASKKHPHIDMAPEDELGRLVESLYPAHRKVYLDVHKLVLDTIPGIVYSVDCVDAGIGYGARQFGYNGWGMVALIPHTSWVSLVFFKGTMLDDTEHLLEGIGALVRHVKLKSTRDLAARHDGVRRLLEIATHINEA